MKSDLTDWSNHFLKTNALEKYQVSDMTFKGYSWSSAITQYN